jgi:rhamnosyltransferase
MSNISLGIVVLTLNAKNTVAAILDKIDYKKYKVLIIDSSSDDNTVEICQKYNCQINIIDRSEFNHGVTREYARKLTNIDIVVFLTQDAIPANIESIDKLISPLIDGKASVSYGKQISKNSTNIFESFPREYNYGDEFQIRSIRDVDKYGIFTFFCSNSCAAWSNKALVSIGGFKPTLTNEDYFACAELLMNGYKVAYVPEAVVTHSHDYTLKQEFQRMFDTGYVRGERPWIQNTVGNASKRGAGYFIALIKKLALENPLLIPYAFLQTTVKYLGYKIGFNALKFPKEIKKRLSDQKYYWDSKYYER